MSRSLVHDWEQKRRLLSTSFSFPFLTDQLTSDDFQTEFSNIMKVTCLTGFNFDYPEYGKWPSSLTFLCVWVSECVSIRGCFNIKYVLNREVVLSAAHRRWEFTATFIYNCATSPEKMAVFNTITLSLNPVFFFSYFTRASQEGENLSRLLSF